MLGATQFSEDTFKQVIGSKADDLFKSDDETMSEAESEILTIINRRKNQSDRTTLNDLKTIFAKKPYGWYQNAVWSIVAKLYKRGKIEIKKDSNVLDDMDVIQALLNSASYANTLLEPQAVIDQKLVKDLNFDVEIFGVATVRESSGLAMSSRNQRLSADAKIKASMLYKILNEIKINPQIIEDKKQELLANGFEKIDYLEIRNEDNLKLNMNIFSSQRRRIFIAVYLEGVRLIDNLSL
jgi:predicted transcriptional regulator